MIFETDVISETNSIIKDSIQAISLRKNNTPNFRYIVSKLYGYTSDSYTDMEYDLSEHGRIIDTDSLVSSAFRKKKQLITKEGVELVSKNKRNLDYIKKRLEELEYVTSMSFEALVDEIAENLVNFNNCFLLKYRNENNSTGRIRETPNKTYKPIAGIYVIAAPTVDTANNKYGQIIKYRHRINDYYTKEFKASDMLHIYHNKRTGITIGTPPLEAVKDDLYALRTIEQCAETMIYRNASPFIHVKVGEKDSPARILSDGTSEIDIYSSIIDNMFEYGGVATPHRVNIDLKGAESQALRLESYLTHFQNRVLAGMCVSSVDLAIGDSTTGGSAGIISQALKDEVRSYQKTISNFISNYLFNELLLESKYYTNTLIIPKEDRVNLVFTENDIDQRIKIESHYLQLLNSGLITKEFAAANIKDMTPKDIAPDPVLPTTPKTGGTANVLKGSSATRNTGKSIKDSLKLNFDNSYEDISKIEQYVNKVLLIDNLSYDILDSIYETSHNNKLLNGETYAYELLQHMLIGLLFNQLLPETTN